MLTDIAFSVFDTLGTAAFAISGAMVACRKQADLFGVVLLAEVTAMGGGMLRDITLGQIPPALFTNYSGLLLSLVMALTVFFMVRCHKALYLQEEQLVEAINNIADALGLGMFAVTGCQVAISCGFGANLLLVISMGVLTAVGGGLLRDVILSEIPFILTKYIYALAAIAGAAVYCLLRGRGQPESASMLCGICVTFLLRLLATRYHWNLPRP